ncbi:C-type lectin domain family 4 member E-like [Oreochromis niloticus]|uniref:C-type lectin domain family 4 member E-like n=1 Tax=Oreochromis niloticus TaxID=8128 RepID=UPI0009059AE5|nr:C-type lectin domain family 4 member E-like [Oreochromis niloticus]
MMSRPQSCIEGGTPSSRHSNSSRRSKVMAERVALVVLCILLAAALIVIYRLSEFGTFENTKIRESLKKLEDHRMKCENVLKENLSKTKPCSTVQPTCPQPPEVTGDSCSKCEEGWEQHGGKCYYFSTSKSSWNKSRDDCRAKGGDLVKIDSREEQEFLWKKVRRMMTDHEDKFWIGLTDSAEQGRWLWVDGSPLNKSLSYWNDSGPDNWPEDDCVLMGDKGDRYLKSWSDASCKVSHRSICEKPAAKGQNKIVCV